MDALEEIVKAAKEHSASMASAEKLVKWLAIATCVLAGVSTIAQIVSLFK